MPAWVIIICCTEPRTTRAGEEEFFFFRKKKKESQNRVIAVVWRWLNLLRNLTMTKELVRTPQICRNKNGGHFANGRAYGIEKKAEVAHLLNTSNHSQELRDCCSLGHWNIGGQKHYFSPLQLWLWVSWLSTYSQLRPAGQVQAFEYFKTWRLSCRLAALAIHGWQPSPPQIQWREAYQR